MAAHAKYPAVHTQLLELAALAKKDGVTFDAFWLIAIRPGEPCVTWKTPDERRPEGCVIWPTDTTDRNISIAATLGARDGWKRAYEGKPAPRKERALVALRPALEKLEELAEASAPEELTAAA